jgi:hypothetical protein
MKFETTYTELASIYASIAKADAKYQELLNASRAYTDASDAYAASGYLMSKANEMSEAFDLRDKAEKALLRTYSKLVDLLGINRKERYGEEAYFLTQSKRCDGSFLYIAKREALRLAKTL